MNLRKRFITLSLLSGLAAVFLAFIGFEEIASLQSPKEVGAFTTVPDTSVIASYWNRVNTAQYGTSFRSNLQSIMNAAQTKTNTYSDDNTILCSSDLDPADNGKLLGFYDKASITSVWDSGTTWNKEHVWPTSRGAGNTGPGVDPHMLRAASTAINSGRSNSMFGIETGSYDPGQYYPEYRGEAARIIFYTATRYYNTCGTGGSSSGTAPLELSETPTDDTDLHTMGKLSLLLEWNEEYPVQPAEIVRNEYIYSYNGIRNPFIDHPDYANYIWSTSEATSATNYQRTTAYNPAGGTVAATSVSLSPSTSSVVAGSRTQFTATVSPDNATNKTVTWSSSNTAIATVDSAGIVTGVAAGTSSIRATSNDNYAIYGEATLTVTPISTSNVYTLVTSVNDLTANSKYILGNAVTGSSFFVSTTIPTSGNNLGQISTALTISSSQVTASSDAMLFTLGGSSGAWTFLTTNCVSTNGYLNATNTTSNNYLRIVATSDNYAQFSIAFSSNAAVMTCTGKTSRNVVRYNATSKIFSCYASTTQAAVYLYKQIQNVVVTGVSLNQTTLSMLSTTTAQLVATVSPDNAANKAVSWTSSNPSVATVSDGNITALSAGTSTITVTTVDGGYSATCLVTVTNPISLTNLNVIGQAGDCPFRTPGYDVKATPGSLVVTADFSDGHTSVVTLDTNTTYSTPNDTILGMTSGTVSYTNNDGLESITKTASYQVRVTNVGAIRTMGSGTSEHIFDSISQSPFMTAGNSSVTSLMLTGGTPSSSSWQKSLDGANTGDWNVTVSPSTANYYSAYEAANGWHIGSSSYPIHYAEFTSVNSISSLSKISVSARANSGTSSGRLYVWTTDGATDTVVQYVDPNTSVVSDFVALTVTATEYTFSLPSVVNGQKIKFRLTNTANTDTGTCVVYLKSLGYYSNGSITNFTYQQQAEATRDYIERFATCNQSEVVIERLALEYNAMNADDSTTNSKTIFASLSTNANQYNYGDDDTYDYNILTHDYTGTGPSGGTVNILTKLTYMVSQFNSGKADSNKIYLYASKYHAGIDNDETVDGVGAPNAIAPVFRDDSGRLVVASNKISSISLTLIAVMSSGVLTILTIFGVYVIGRKKNKESQQNDSIKS